MSKPHLIILGAGPAGLGAASQAVRTGTMDVTVLEKNQWVGGNAGSFELAGQPVDFGSHRLHPSCDPLILADIREMLGDDLLDRPRHGRIRLQSRWIHFPLKPFDLLFSLSPSFTFGVIKDVFLKLLPRDRLKSEEENFAKVMVRGLGSTICRDFYFPYARKLWGLVPEELSAVQARRRVANNSLFKMFIKVLSIIPGIKSSQTGHFFYPRKGFGQISHAYSHAAQEGGARVILGSTVTSVKRLNEGGFQVIYDLDGSENTLTARQVWSTIPITALARILEPAPPESSLNAANEIDYRAMLLIYLVLEQNRFSEYDAHYFPETSIKITRLSEPKNYSKSNEPENRTVLCAELPCSPVDPEWTFGDDDLAALTLQSLESAGIPVESPVSQVYVRRLRFAYPIYRQGFEAYFDRLDGWVDRFEGLLTFGRQGLFAHDNTHHALYMAYSAVSCLDENGYFDQQRWLEYRRIFETHVVED